MKDITSGGDIKQLMQSFYGRALGDELIGFFFTEVAPLNMAVHMPLIADFWETVIFGKAAYRGNVLQVHQHIHALHAFEEKHFTRWVTLFQSAVDELFAGNNAELVKQRAASIATVMRIKLLHGGIGVKK